MKICHIITRLIIGGAQENTLSTIQGLMNKRDCEVDLVVGPQTGPEGTLIGEARAQGVNVIIEPSLLREVRPWDDLKALGRLTKLLREKRYDVVHTHSAKGGILGRLAAHRARIPVIVHTIHGPTFHSNLGLLTRWLYCSAEKYVAPVTTHFVSVADAMTEQYLAAGIGQRQRYTTIRSGIDLDAYVQVVPDPTLRASLGLQTGDRVIGKIARLFELKGHDFLLAAAPAIAAAEPQTKFLLIGDGNLRERLEREVRRLGLHERFIFAGLIPPADIPRYIALMDVLVHLSLREGLPRALVQALAAGKPVVAFDVDGAREVVRHEETGLLIPSRDVAKLQAATIRLLRDRALAARLGATGQRRVQTEFSRENMVNAIYNLYLRLLAEAQR